MVEKQTAGRDNLGNFAPKFAQLNDDVLFGEVWSREDKLSAHDRSVITLAALISGVYSVDALRSCFLGGAFFFWAGWVKNLYKCGLFIL